MHSPTVRYNRTKTIDFLCPWEGHDPLTINAPKSIVCGFLTNGQSPIAFSPLTYQIIIRKG